MNKLELRDGLVSFNYLDRIVHSIGTEDYTIYISEDLLSVSYFNEEYIIDLGCYSVKKEDVFIIRLIKSHNWDYPVYEKRLPDLNDIYSEVNKVVDYIYELVSN
ncbi:hypothetical protein M3223_10725 [Paenibacillus pasadenensis]|uniref:hypothetical protein n=1 Tax=Paenibacillus pasadenensis TaxID=217090 RepID=UPI00203E802E|nr:hypothetical protein [Paenibacillus pasadenensis]MCM3747832.1 hypothetical protein [Paenibacillus pasadenensis]